MDALLTTLLIALSWFAGGIVGGATGMGSVMVAMPLLTTVISPGDAVLVSCIVSFYASIHQTMSYRKYFLWEDTWPLALGVIPGCLLGVLVLMVATMQMLSFMVCLCLVCFITMQLNRRIAQWRVSPARSIAAFAGGVFGFVTASVSMGGGPLAIYVMLRHWGPDRARGNMSFLWALTSITTCIIQAFAGLYTWPLLKIGFIGIVGTGLGQIVGVRLGRRIDQQLFRRILLIFLAISAAILFRRAIS